MGMVGSADAAIVQEKRQTKKGNAHVRREIFASQDDTTNSTFDYHEIYFR